VNGLPRPSEWGVALVTGASRGIGRAFAVELGARGVRLVLVARDEGRLRELAAALPEGSRPEILVADLADPADLARVEQRLARREDPVDLLVNNAVLVRTGAVAEAEIEREAEMVQVNALAVCRLSTTAARRMKETGGAICNVSSLGYRAPMPGNATYGATKAFITSFTLALAAELAPTRATATVLHPGFVATEVHERSGFDASWVPAGMWLAPEQVARVGLRDVERGRARSVPGWRYAAIDHLADFLPQGLSRLSGRYYVDAGRLGARVAARLRAATGR